MSCEREDFLSDLYGKSLIAYGTGNVGKVVIPYLVRNPNIDLRGVTNSRTVENDAGGFLDTGLPFHSLRRWAEILPDASILIVAQRGYDDIYAACRDAGFQDILFAPAEMIMAGMTAAQDIAEARLMGDLNSLCLANEIHDVHMASFSEFKGRHRGQDVVVVGCGPTLNYYEPISGLPHIGINSVFLNQSVKLDYYFLLHYTPEWCEELKRRDFVKFFMVNRNDNSDDKFPEYVMEENHARRFFQYPLSSRIQPNIEYYPLAGFCSVIFPAIQFALYTRPKRILLVGCDCSQNGHFDGRGQNVFEGDVSIPLWLKGYQKMKTFAARHYPDTEIISVNPVGLKGMFRDVYTRPYLTVHPETATWCEILDDARR